MPTIFLDHQSSTPVLAEVFEAMRPFFVEQYGNPSSLHHLGNRARRALDQARGQVASFLHATSPDEIVFTSGGTEAANLAVKGAAYASERRGKHIVLSAIEHPSVLNSVAFLEQHGFSATRVRVDRAGWVDPAEVKSAIRPDTILVCVHHANHDVGTIEPIAQIAELANDRGIPLFVDAAASAGWLPINVEALGISLLSLSPHRFYGPKGVGVLYRNRATRLSPLLHGGDQEQRRRAGTENVPGIVGAGVAAEMAGREQAHRQEHTAALQQYLWRELKRTVTYLALNGPEPGPHRLSTNLNLSAEFTEGEGQLLSLDMAGIVVGSGTSCVSKSLKPSHVLEAMGVPAGLAQASILISLGEDNTKEEMDVTVSAYAKTINKLRSMSPLWEDFQKGLLASSCPRELAKPSLTCSRPAAPSTSDAATGN
jgi:cysteine desulfurase